MFAFHFSKEKFSDPNTAGVPTSQYHFHCEKLIAGDEQVSIAWANYIPLVCPMLFSWSFVLIFIHHYGFIVLVYDSLQVKNDLAV